MAVPPVFDGQETRGTYYSRQYSNSTLREGIFSIDYSTGSIIYVGDRVRDAGVSSKHRLRGHCHLTISHDESV